MDIKTSVTTVKSITLSAGEVATLASLDAPDQWRFTVVPAGIETVTIDVERSEAA